MTLHVHWYRRTHATLRTGAVAMLKGRRFAILRCRCGRVKLVEKQQEGSRRD